MANFPILALGERKDFEGADDIFRTRMRSNPRRGNGTLASSVGNETPAKASTLSFDGSVDVCANCIGLGYYAFPLLLILRTSAVLRTGPSVRCGLILAEAQSSSPLQLESVITE